MKATGIVRRVDTLGRIVLPKELRDTMGIDADTPMEIYVIEDRMIVMSPIRLQCVCCGNREEERLIVHNGVHLCPECLKEFKRREGQGKSK